MTASISLSFVQLVFCFNVRLVGSNCNDTVMAAKIGEANNQFALRLFSDLKSNDSNVLFSPWSMFNALAMAFVGGRGNTAQQMSEALGLTNPGSLQDMLNVLKLLQDVKAVKSANKMWMQSNFNILSEFQEHLKRYFLSEAGEVDFINDSESARVKINCWVEEQTKSKIKNLIPPGVLDSLTRLVLTSAVYFKESWLKEFPKENTQSMKFYVDSSKSTMVQMMYMNAKEDVMYHEEGNFQVLSLPYIGQRLTMNIILPRKGVSLESILCDLKKGKLLMNTITKPSMRPGNIEIYIPQFKFDFTQTYNTLLQNLGLTDMFSDVAADFSGVTNVLPGLNVTAVIQKAFIEVNEEGTEAAAATAVVMGLRCAMPKRKPPVVFKADRPFIFLIYEKKSNVILFMGKVTDPNK